MRDRSGPQRVTNVELFYDLVFVFAVTQLSHFLLSGGGLLPGGSAEDQARIAFRAALLLTMVWLVWSTPPGSPAGSIPAGSPFGCCCSCSR